MPQFDQVSFSNQVLWLFIIFLNFYFLITYFFLPFLCETFKFRKKKLLKNNKDFDKISLEHFYQNLLGNKIFQQIILHSDNTLKLIHTQTVENKTEIKTNLLNNSYLKTTLVPFWVQIISYPNFFK